MASGAEFADEPESVLDVQTPDLGETHRHRINRRAAGFTNAELSGQHVRVAAGLLLRLTGAPMCLNNTKIAMRLGIDVRSARKWRNRFAEHRLDGLTDEPRPGQPRKITDEKVEEVIVKTLESTPKDATHWSTRSMAKEVG
jgi:hypothetical protein